MAKQRQTSEITFEGVVECGCGLDVHKKEIVATVSGTSIKSETRTFQSTTRSLTELKEWLLALGVTHVAMESTGVYWKPVLNILENDYPQSYHQHSTPTTATKPRKR